MHGPADKAETAACPLCAAPSAFVFGARDYNRRVSDEAFRYYRCPSCSLTFLSPVPEGLRRYYPADYHATPSSREELTRLAEAERYKIDIVTRYVASGRLLEIGPGWGGFAALARQSGFEVDAVEADKTCCRFLEQTVGVRAICSADVPRAIPAEASYHVVALWHTIEHLPDPWSTLEAVATKLLPGGILVVAAPNPRAWQFRVMGSRWPHVDAPRHLELIPAELLAERARALGLDVLLVTTNDKGSLGWNLFGWEMLLANCVSNRFAKSCMRVAGSVIGRILGPLERGDGRGSAYTAVFGKGRRA